MKRRRLSTLPLQGNFYPVASMMYIQDKKSRLSIVSGQPLGGTSLGSGELEIMLDRKIKLDDHRGLQQGIMDNKVLEAFLSCLSPTHFFRSLDSNSFCFWSSKTQVVWQSNLTLCQVIQALLVKQSGTSFLILLSGEC